MKNSMDERFEEVKRKGEKALISYISGGFPNKERCIEAVMDMERGGVDIVEIGIPYSDPLADGPTIQRSSNVAIQNGANARMVLEIISEIRRTSMIPIVIMTYYNSVYRYGIEDFISDMKTCGAQGLIIPDLPLEERGGLYRMAVEKGIHLIPLVAMTSGERVKKIVENSSGFIYCVSQNGVTGNKKEISDDVGALIKEVKKHSKIPVAVGFGIKDAKTASYFSAFADGIICGSAYIENIESGKDIEAFSRILKSSIRQDRGL